METDLLEAVIQGGAIGLCALLIAYSAWKDRMYNRTLNNHLKHLNETLSNVNTSIKVSNNNHDHLLRTLDRNAKTTGKCGRTLEKTVYVMDRLEKKLNNL